MTPNHRPENEGELNSPLNDLTVLEQGHQLNRRDEILEALGQRANQSNKGFTGKYEVTNELNSPVKTTEDIALEIGISKRTAQHYPVFQYSGSEFNSPPKTTEDSTALSR